MPNPAETAFEQGLRRALCPYPADARYLVGVSGGRDSVALLHGLVTLGYRRLVVCHLDHGLRAEAKGDAEFVRQLAEELRLPVASGEADVRKLAQEEKRSLEAAAREARYRFFAQVAGRRRCRTLFLAHHADDQVETFLFNLLRGVGPAGLAGMQVETTRQIGQVELTIVRPLLAVWREEINAYLAGRQLSWREDSTNADASFGTRNRLRAEALPMLERLMGRPVKPALWRAADLLSAEEDWAAARVQETFPLPARLPIATLLAQPLAQQRRALLAWLQAAAVPGVGYREVEAVRSLLDKAQGPAKINLPGNRHARRRDGMLFLE